MKTIHAAQLSSLLLLALPGCFPDTNTTAADEARRALESSQSAYEQQAAEMQRHSEDLQKQLAELQKNIKDKENAELKTKLDAIQRENEKLMADAAAAQKRSDELRDQLAAANAKPTMPSVVPMPVPTPAPAPAPMANQPWSDPDADYSMFYNSLSPHGRWLEVDGYGYAFRPSYSDRVDWRPYVDGRWVWTDQGWAWDTPEPIGWACYHYGRWVRISRHGWVWLPGRQWAPAWVSWRRSPDYIGWAPLPPSVGYGAIGHDCDARYGLAPTSYTFIQATNFGRSNYINICVSSSTIPTFFHQTLNVTNIVQVSHNQSTHFMHRGGPELDWVEQRCGSRITRAPIQFASILDRPHIHGSGNSAGLPGFMAAPMPGRRSGPGHSVIPKISERISRPVFDDDWKSIPEAIRDRLREGISKEARGARPQPILTVMPPAEVKKPTPITEIRPAPPPSKTKLPMPEVRPGIPIIEKPKKPDTKGDTPAITSPGFPVNRPVEAPRNPPNSVGMKGREIPQPPAATPSLKDQQNAIIMQQEIARRRAEEQAEALRRQQEMQKQPIIRPGTPINNGGSFIPKQTPPKTAITNVQRQQDIQKQIDLQRLKQQESMQRAIREAQQRQSKPTITPKPTINPQSPAFNQGNRGTSPSPNIRKAPTPQRKIPGAVPQIIIPQKKKLPN